MVEAMQGLGTWLYQVSHMLENAQFTVDSNLNAVLSFFKFIVGDATYTVVIGSVQVAMIYALVQAGYTAYKMANPVK